MIPLFDYIAGTINGAYWGKKGGRFHSRDALIVWQSKILARQLSRLRLSSLHYQSVAKSDALASFPVMNKAVLMENFDRINTTGLFREQVELIAKTSEQNRDFTPTVGGITVGRSTGTSGHHGIFAVNSFERGFWAGYILRRLLPHGFLSKERIALVLRSGSNLYQAVGRGRITFRYFDLTQPITQILEDLASYRPTVVVATPTVLKIIAERRKDLNLNPHMIVSAADVLEPSDRSLIRDVFGVQVHQIYQATEGLLGLSCAYGNIHLCEDLAHFEYQSFDNDRVSPIITDLRRQTLPLVRYQMNDLLILKSDPCPCGSPLQAIERIEGRTDQVVYATSVSGETLRPIFPDFLRHSLSDALEQLKLQAEYRVTQTRPDSLVIGLTKGHGVREVEEVVNAHLSELFVRNHCRVPLTTFESIDDPSLLHKRRRIVQRYAGTGVYQ